MVDRPKKPSALSATPGLAPQPQINITHSNSRVSAVLPTGESLEILLYGATIISWKDASGAEKLWLSDKAILDGTKAVRGGIPLVFPMFGKVEGDEGKAKGVDKLPQHGFARNCRWEFLGKSTSESSSTQEEGGDSSVKLDFGLSGSNLPEETRKLWGEEFGLIYSVTLGREGLGTSMVVRNEGSKAWEFQILMHTYLRIQDISQISVTGLESSKYTDKVTDPISTTTSPSEALTISSKTDRVYTPAGGPSAPIVVSEGGKKKFTVARDNMNEVVVWNPWIDAKDIGDFGPKDGWREMICVEAGCVSGWQKLEAGETWEGGQIITAHN
ncbi:aldose 1-epimerase protein [Rutstroemia sp. NJR-2017a BBW]|nr:aldose 1-epimerase protein [Rutstroemia sp. NJR-2017a BBW]